MRAARFIVLVITLLAVAAANPAVASAKNSTHTVVKVFHEGEAFCPRRVFVLGRVAVQSGRCYIPVVLRDRRGAFLAFMDPSVSIPRGQLVRLDTPEGRKAKSRIFFLVPIQMTWQIGLIPVNTIQLIQLQEEDEVDEDEDEDHGDFKGNFKHSRLIIVLPTMQTPSLIVTFIVNF